MKKSVECAVKHDALPEVVDASDILFNQHPYDRKYEDIPLWMRKYAQDNDLLMVIFGKDED